MTPREFVLLEYEQLPIGTSMASQLCPACNGGDSGEKTLSVSRNDTGLVWMCHRAACTFRGAERSLRSFGGQRTHTPPARGVIGREYIRSSSILPDRTREMFNTKYLLENNTLATWGVGWARQENRVVVPVRDRMGEDLGCQLRSYSGDTPKTISHTEPNTAAWYARQGDSRHLILVEDQVSAMRLWQRGFSAVSLLGTHLSEEMVSDIRKAKFHSVILALDKDALPKSIQYVIKYRSYLPMLVLPLIKDIKDQTEQELTTTLSGLT